MKKIGLILLAGIISLSTFAQKQIDDANAEVRNVKGFHAIKVSTGIEVLLTQASTEAVAVSATYTEDREHIKTIVENGVLKIYFDNPDWLRRDRKGRRLKAYVSAKDIDGVDLSSGASVKIEGELKTAKLTMDLSSGAMFKGQVDVTEMLNVDQSSGSQANISGKAAGIRIDGSSGSVFNGYDLVAENAEVETSSGSSTELTVNKELSARASSGGSVRYKGAGVIRNIKTGSGGAVSKSR